MDQAAGRQCVSRRSAEAGEGGPRDDPRPGPGPLLAGRVGVVIRRQGRSSTSSPQVRTTAFDFGESSFRSRPPTCFRCNRRRTSPHLARDGSGDPSYGKPKFRCGRPRRSESQSVKSTTVGALVMAAGVRDPGGNHASIAIRRRCPRHLLREPYGRSTRRHAVDDSAEGRHSDVGEADPRHLQGGIREDEGGRSVRNWP